MDHITATKARYIKLGEKGQWEELCLNDGTLRLRFLDIPHDLGMKGDKSGIVNVYRSKGRDAGAAANLAGQILSFYDADPTTLWITFADGYLWWTFAEPEVIYLGNDPTHADKIGSRYRRTIGGWRNTTLAGKELRIEELSGQLTQTAGYRMTICNIRPEVTEYLLRIINEESSVSQILAQKARAEALKAMEGMIKSLQPGDFELFVELVFTRLGWQRTGSLGRTQKTVDMNLYLPASDENAFVQVKSRTTQAELQTYIDAFARRGENRMFFAYHTSKTPLVSEDERVQILDGTRLAGMAWRAGLFDWLMQMAK